MPSLIFEDPQKRDILKDVFELLGSFDEVASLGYREQVKLMQVQNEAWLGEKDEAGRVVGCTWG